MARITVEDCVSKVDNIFDLVLLAARRARRLANGAEAFIEWENDKPTVVALREIAEGHITPEIMDELEAPKVEDMEAELSAEDIAPPPTIMRV